MIYSKWGNMRYKYRNRESWCRGYYVDTVGKNTKKIKEYIANQLKEDKISDQMTIEEIDPFKGQQLTVAKVSRKGHFSEGQQRSLLGVKEKPPAMLVEIY